MSNLKDSDIDDLFRRASDKYPLRTDSADWDRMAAALENKGTIPPADGVDVEEKRKKRRFFWLFLLLPLAGAGYYTLHHTGNAANANVATTVGSSATASAPATPSSPTSSATNPSAPATASAPAGSATETKGSKGTKPDNSLSLTAANARRQPGGDNDANKFGDKNEAIQNGPGQNRHSKNGTNGSNIQNGTNGGNTENGTVESSNENGYTQNSAIGATTTGIGSKALVAGNDRLFFDLQRAPIPHDYRLTVDVTAPAAKKDSIAKPKAKTKHFYAGVFGSPDLSTVKMQSVNGVGTTFGVILGYTFNGGRWALETGAYLDRKKYYTEGQYFNTKEVRLPYNSYLTDVYGICYMWEIPLNVRYNFNPGAKTSWFATAGLSTYLMSHEKYTYGLEWPGSTSVYDSTRNFHKASQYPFSIINLSAGFEQRLGKIGNLRVEPYVRIPLTGLGTGKLPIMSAGVNIGITRQLW